jgi:hypothetical protein
MEIFLIVDILSVEIMEIFTFLQFKAIFFGEFTELFEDDQVLATFFINFVSFPQFLDYDIGIWVGANKVTTLIQPA